MEGEFDAMLKGAQDGYRWGNWLVQAFSQVLFVLSRPFVLVTQVFLRKDMGERYFTLLQAHLSALLILVAAGITVATGKVMSNMYDYSERASDFQVAAGYTIGIIWFWAFCAACGFHLFVVFRRRRGLKPILWHSRCGGVPWVPALNFPIQLGIVAVLAIIMFCTRLYAFGALLALSCLMTAASEYHARRRLYERVLDAIDGQLDGEWLGKAIEERLSAAQAQGVEGSLPAHVSDQYRQKLAAFFKGQPEPTKSVAN